MISAKFFWLHRSSPVRVGEDKLSGKDHWALLEAGYHTVKDFVIGL